MRNVGSKKRSSFTINFQTFSICFICNLTMPLPSGFLKNSTLAKSVLKSCGRSLPRTWNMPWRVRTLCAAYVWNVCVKCMCVSVFLFLSRYIHVIFFFTSSTLHQFWIESITSAGRMVRQTVGHRNESEESAWRQLLLLLLLFCLFTE